MSTKGCRVELTERRGDMTERRQKGKARDVGVRSARNPSAECRARQQVLYLLGAGAATTKREVGGRRRSKGLASDGSPVANCGVPAVTPLALSSIDGGDHPARCRLGRAEP